MHAQKRNEATNTAEDRSTNAKERGGLRKKVSTEVRFTLRQRNKMRKAIVREMETAKKWGKITGRVQR